MSTVLIATDGSTAAVAAVETGVHLASEHGLDAVFLHAYQEMDVIAAPFAPVFAVPRERIEPEEDVPLVTAAEVAERAGVAHQERLVAGHAVDAILRVANEVDAEMIVVGSNRHGALGTALLGSASLELLRRARRPGLVVHPTPAPIPVG
jgi:nucleotide-binding universal stress UspA family protein